jgi:hypothetical protein
LKDRFRSSPFAARCVALVPIVQKEPGHYTASRSYDERRHQILHKVISLLFEGFNDAHRNGVYWRDADQMVQRVVPWISHWLADGKERQSLTGFLRVRPASG